MNSKLLVVVLSLSIVGLFGSFAFLGAPEISETEVSYSVVGATSLNLSGITTTITELFMEILPLVAYMSIFGGLMAALPKFFKFKM